MSTPASNTAQSEFILLHLTNSWISMAADFAGDASDSLDSKRKGQPPLSLFVIVDTGFLDKRNGAGRVLGGPLAIAELALADRHIEPSPATRSDQSSPRRIQNNGGRRARFSDCIAQIGVRFVRSGYSDDEFIALICFSDTIKGALRHFTSPNEGTKRNFVFSFPRR
jgi:hypothetical protein